ncbi:MAG: hypothetical protein IAG13_36345, partial [Deltaproteobacteria bacterium]|nr:hypothetical protein [Nannocystaceae bacterium]
ALALVARGSDGVAPIDAAALGQRLARPEYAEIAMVDVRDVLASRVLDTAALTTVVGDAPHNTDLTPVVMFAAPRAAYEPDPARGARNLAALLELRTPLPASRLAGGDAPELHAEVLRFGDALEQFLRGEILVVEGGQASSPSSAAIDAYLRAYAIAPDFPPPRGRLYPFAARFPELAERILPAMRDATPDEPRVWTAWLEHLKRIGDRERFDAALAEAQARFGTPELQSPG